MLEPNCRGEQSRHHPDTLTRPEKITRLSRLIELQRELGSARNARYVGQEIEVIIEEAQETHAIGRTSFNKPVQLPPTSQPLGSFARVKIEGVKVSSFFGREV